MHKRRSSIVAALSVVATMLAAFIVTIPNADATSYRYWTYWVGGSGGWSFSHQGAAHQPADGTVEGWRFAISKEAGSSATPRVSSSFDEICGKTDPVDGKKRVGLVVDFGVSTDAPPGETPPKGPVARCFVLPTNATGYDVLVAATSIRVDQGLICGIAGYPRAGCGEAVSNPKPTPSPTHSGGQSGNPGNSGGSSGQSDHSTKGDPDPSAGPTRTDHPSKGSSQPKHRHQNAGANHQPSTSPQPPANSDDEEPVKASVALNADLPNSPEQQQSPIGLLIGLTIVFGLLGAALYVARRR